MRVTVPGCPTPSSGDAICCGPPRTGSTPCSRERSTFRLRTKPTAPWWRGAGRNYFYVDHPPARLITGPRTSVDRTALRNGPPDDPTKPRLRDWGIRRTPGVRLLFAPDLGVVAGIGETGTWYGFRQDPYET